MTRGPSGAGRIAFRVDSSAALGAGHLRRCLTLAEALRSRGRDILFLCRADPQSLGREVEAAGFTLIELGAGAPDAEASDSALAPFAPLEAIVVDHYGLGAEWERTLRPLAGKMVAIDDLADRPHHCDILMDAAPGAARYDGLVPDDCVRLIGPAFAMLRPEFHRLRGERAAHGLGRILVSFGTTDADDRCTIAVGAIRAALGPEVAIDVVLGRNAPHLAALQSRADAALTIHVDTDRVAGLMAAADLAIGAGGLTSWERACLGLPALVACIAENQRDTIAALTEAGAAIELPADEGMGDAIAAALVSVPALLGPMSEAALQLTDGRGAERVARAVAPPVVTLREATADDSRMAWTWRNSPQVREHSKDSRPIDWETHCRWYESRLTDPACDLLIGEEGGQGVGVLRFDHEADAATVSVYLSPDCGGRGLGTALIRAGEAWLRAHRPAVRRILADILPGNRASLAAFESAHYVARLSQYERDLSNE